MGGMPPIVLSSQAVTLSPSDRTAIFESSRNLEASHTGQDELSRYKNVYDKGRRLLKSCGIMITLFAGGGGGLLKNSSRGWKWPEDDDFSQERVFAPNSTMYCLDVLSSDTSPRPDQFAIHSTVTGGMRFTINLNHFKRVHMASD